MKSRIRSADAAQISPNFVMTSNTQWSSAFTVSSSKHCAATSHAQVFGGNVGAAGDKQTAMFEVTDCRSEMQRRDAPGDHKTNEGALNNNSW